MLKIVNFFSPLWRIVSASVLTTLAQRGMSKYIQSINFYFPLDLQTKSRLLCEAIEAGHIDTVRVLVTELGANVNATEAVTPLLVATSRFNSNSDDVSAAIVDILIQAGADFSVMDSLQNTLLNRAAKANKFKTFKVILDAIESVKPEDDTHDPKLITYINHSVYPFDAPPLYYACQNQNTDFVNYLLAHGADPHIIQGSGTNLNLVELAKKKPTGSNTYKHTSFSLFLKQKIGISKPELETLRDSMRSIIAEQMALSKKNNKKIIIVVGETHGHYHAYLVEKEILKIAKELGVLTYYCEQSSVDYDPRNDPVEKFAHEKLNMAVVPIDNHPDKLTCRFSLSEGYLSERNAIMAKEINDRDCDAILITGAYHLMGLIEDINTRIDPDKYHILPLSMVLTSEPMMSLVRIPEAQFALDPERVIQIDRNGIIGKQALVRP